MYFLLYETMYNKIFVPVIQKIYNNKYFYYTSSCIIKIFVPVIQEDV